MFIWRCLICVMLAGGVACGLAKSDSWQLMVEAGLDGPDRRITPKSVFIAPVHASRSERCRPGYRFDHLGRCVKVVRVDANAQVHLFLKHLQGTQGLTSSAPLTASAPSSNGPLQFSLPIAKIETVSTEASTTTTSTEPTTVTTTTTTTEDELSTTVGQGVTTISSWDQTISTLPIDGSGSGDESTITSVFDGSGEQPTEITSYATLEESGSGAEPTTTEEERDARSTTTSSSEEAETSETPPLTTTTTMRPIIVENRTPIPPNNATASLIMAILRGIQAWKASESTTPAPITAKFETNTTVLIPLETIKLDLSDDQKVPFTTTERTILQEDSVIKVNSQENKFSDPSWFSSSWIRFPDEQDEDDSMEITPVEEDFSPRFRFPEENVNPDQRPALLKFWSRIPMYKEEIQSSKSDEQWTAP